MTLLTIPKHFSLHSMAGYVSEEHLLFLPVTPHTTLCPMNNMGVLWFKASRKFRDHCQDFVHMWKAFVESNMQKQTLV